MFETIETNGLEVAHVAPDGAAGRPPLVLIHGTVTNYVVWQKWMAALPGRGWEAYAVSLRAHGGSYGVDGETYCSGLRLEDYVDDVAAVTARIGRPCVIVGHSMGGIVAQRYVARGGGPETLGLVLLASVPPGQLGPIRTEPLPTDRPFFYSPTSVASESPSVMNDFSTGAGIPIEPGQIACPVLSISAELDATKVPKDDRVARYYGAEYHLAKGIGHELMLDDGWERVFDLVMKWLDDNIASPVS